MKVGLEATRKFLAYLLLALAVLLVSTMIVGPGLIPASAHASSVPSLEPARSQVPSPATEPWVPPTGAIAGFVLLLLGIAILPLVAPHWWERNRNKAIFTAILGVPFAIYVGVNHPMSLVNSIHEYFQFLTLLFCLFVISGGIWLSGDIRAIPRNNVVFLAVGAVIASFIGTTGACMLLIRPLLSSNSERQHVKHTVIFFIFIVANIGGSLTPLGDPPLFLGYLRGVPFLWTFKLWHLWLPTCAGLIVLYALIDKWYWDKETAAVKHWDYENVKPLQLRGALNFLFLLGVIAAIFFNPYLDKYLIESAGLSHKTVEWLPIREAVMLAMAWLSWRTTKQQYRQAQRFTFAPIIEVAVLFLGIFITMIPALLILYDWGPRSPIQKPWHFFWATGVLSSFLDNAPTYLTYLALGMGQAHPGDPDNVRLLTGEINSLTLLAISAGAVFMGANTYIGNAPNFMVKAIAEENKVKMPSFFGYMLWSLLILEPTFIIITLIFFR
jgi:Na+/H+ antiporter NhaD/arsenite permease-like protein